MGFTIVIAYGRADNEDSTRGGVLTVIDDKSLTLKRTLHNEPGFQSFEVEWGAQILEVANVYAPAQPIGRIDFFNTLRRKLSKHTYVGGDWNTVPDTTLDVNSANPLQYANRGATLLAQVMSEFGLMDERRDQLGNEREFTRDGSTRNGQVSSRLDRWYTPIEQDFLLTFKVENSFIFKSKSSDHRSVFLTLDNRMGKRGQERITLDETLISEIQVQEKIQEIVDEAYQGNHSQAKKWKRAHEHIKDYLLHESRQRKKRTNSELKKLRAMLKFVNFRNKRNGSTELSAACEKKIQREIFELESPEVIREPTEREALNMYDRAEVSTKAHFMTYKQKAKQQWINEMKKAEWTETETEGTKPTFNGSTKNMADIGNEFAKYYKVLFETKKIDAAKANRLLKELGKKKIYKDARNTLDEPFDEQVVLDTMENLPLGKQAGPNRIPNALYKRMSTVFAPLFTALINETRHTKKLPKHFLEGDISMLYKKDARDDPRHYRPITLLNTDYKIFTRILARRMGTMVHQFVSECQKGFVPDTFIGEASMLMRMIEAYINEDEDNRQGAFLFLDMEKAFDRVSYEFTNKGLEALGFGKHFKNWVGMMYNTDNAPKRRMYVNGYYSEQFQIKSGVAQGCPLSPLLFLIVAEALKISMDLEPGVKGITINDVIYKLTQFADDTTIFMGNIREEKAVTRALQSWCAATGMRENVKKREGLAMGKYKNQDLGRGIKWAPENGWCVSLGVPIGNDLNEAKWWGEKINKVRTLAQQWIGLKRSQYFGRNLIVQGMYYGRLRYWLYSVNMDKRLYSIVQKDADILNFSRDPTLEVGTDADGKPTKNAKRIRKFVANDTAIGPKPKGGLNTMDWAIHASNFKAQWVLRYLDPSKSSYKTLIDSFILYDKRRNCKYPEGRQIILQNLSVRERANMLSALPKTATYIKECFREFWKLNIRSAPDTWEGIGSESPWHGRRMKIDDVHDTWRTYFKHTLEIWQWSDFMNKDTNRLFTRGEWRDFVERLEKKHHNRTPTNLEIIENADAIVNIQKQIPREARLELRKAHTVPAQARQWVYLQRRNISWPAIVIDDTKAQRVWIDKVGRGHKMQVYVDHRHYSIIKAHTWHGKWAGPHGNYPVGDTKWKLPFGNAKEHKLQQYSINVLTKARQLEKMKPPASVTAWTARIGDLPWHKIWQIKPMYVAPRDTATWLKIQHRTLWVAKNGGCDSTTCNAAGCQHEETQLHLMTCSIIKSEYWEKIVKYARTFGIDADNRPAYWLGYAGNGKAVGREQAAIIALAWRSLYAQVVKARLDNKVLRLDVAYYNFTRFMISRVKAYGTKWRRWFLNQRLWQQTRMKMFPLRHRNNALIKLTAEAEYTIADGMYRLMDEARHQTLP